MRVKYSLINVATGLGNQVIITALSFVSRTVFITYLGVEYLGINALFTSILAMLALAEAGIGSSIVYSLYKPVAENNEQKINLLMRLYRNAYLVIAGIVTVLGLAMLPFLHIFVGETSVENVQLIFLIFLLNTVLPYLYLHKHSFLNVCQKTYIITIIYSISSIVTISLKIAVLYYTHNFILYLAIESFIIMTTAIVLAVIVNKMYPFLKNKVVGKLDSETKQTIKRNIKAIVLQNIGVYLVFGTDNIIISTFVSITAVGIYSNYFMLIEICRTFINQIFNNIYHSVGNLVAKESREKVYQIFKVTMFLNFWLYSLFAICLLIMLEPFITLWIGTEFLLSPTVLILLIIIFYERGMRNSISTVKTTSGIFHEDRYAPLIQAGINLTLSIILVQQYGIMGVFMATLFSAVVVPFWLTPYLVYKKVFEIRLVHYFKRYMGYVLVAMVAFFVTNYLTSFIEANTYYSLILKGIVCFIVPNVLYTALYFKSNEFVYLYTIMKNLINKVFKKKKNTQTQSVNSTVESNTDK